MADIASDTTEDIQPFDVATAADPSHVMPIDSFDPTKTINALTGKYHGNSQECVASVQQLNNLPRTSDWKPLGPVSEDTQIGAPIAVFNRDGKYTNIPGQSHAGTYLGVDANGRMLIGEQWNGKGGAWHVGTIPATGQGGWRDATSYRVVGTDRTETKTAMANTNTLDPNNPVDKMILEGGPTPTPSTPINPTNPVDKLIIQGGPTPRPDTVTTAGQPEQSKEPQPPVYGEIDPLTGLRTQQVTALGPGYRPDPFLPVKRNVVTGEAVWPATPQFLIDATSGIKGGVIDRAPGGPKFYQMGAGDIIPPEGTIALSGLATPTAALRGSSIFDSVGALKLFGEGGSPANLAKTEISARSIAGNKVPITMDTIGQPAAPQFMGSQPPRNFEPPRQVDLTKLKGLTEDDLVPKGLAKEAAPNANPNSPETQTFITTLLKRLPVEMLSGAGLGFASSMETGMDPLISAIVGAKVGAAHTLYALVKDRYGVGAADAVKAGIPLALKAAWDASKVANNPANYLRQYNDQQLETVRRQYDQQRLQELDKRNKIYYPPGYI